MSEFNFISILQLIKSCFSASEIISSLQVINQYKTP